MNTALSFEANLLNAIESKPEGVTESEIFSEFGQGNLSIAPSLAELATKGAIERREVGGMVMWYPLFRDSIKKVLIVEDEQHINDLMKASLGKGYSFEQAFDGNTALEKIKSFAPDLVLLDIMLPGPDGLEICNKIKSDPKTKDMVVIMVSAADERRQRFKSIHLGADYYMKKPFEPKVLKSLANIFLRKKGKKFDPLVDLPDTERLSREVESVLEEDFEVNNIKIRGIDAFRKEHGDNDANTVIRLVSQIIQDKAREWGAKNGFVGYIGNGEFVVCGGKNETSMVLSEVNGEFERVMPFLKQHYNPPKGVNVSLDITDLFTGQQGIDLYLEVKQIPLDRIVKKRDEIHERVVSSGSSRATGEYTLAEIGELFGSGEMDFVITRTPDGETKISISKNGEKKK